MKFDTKIFQSKIARRIFLMFVSSALLPVFCLSIISYKNVTKQLHKQSSTWLHRSVKGYGLSLYERLMFLESNLQLVASSLRKTSETSTQASFNDFNERFASRFRSVALFGNLKEYRPIFKTMNQFKKPNEEENKHLNAGKTVISIVNHSNSSPQIMMIMPTDPENLNAGYLMGEINPNYLWGIDQGNTLPPNTEFCVLDASKNVLFNSISYPDSFYRQVYSNLSHSSSGQFEFALENQKYLVSYWTAFMKPRFLVRGWTSVISQPKDNVLTSISHFKTIFPLVVLLSLWVVLLFSIYSIRKSLVPLELLKKGTRRIAMKDFDCQVNVTSGDEFEDLAVDFNKMAAELNRQFKNLDTRSEIDRAILSSLDARIIVETIIHRIYDWFACDSIAISLLDSDKENAARVYYKSYNQGKELSETSIEFSSYDLDTFKAHSEFIIVDADRNQFSFLSTFIEQGNKSFLILPIFVKVRLKAVIVIGRLQTKAFNIEEILQTQQMADQMAVALSNATLVEEMEQLNWGTLKALARTVDAKSSWTAGHSTRVTNMAMKIGSVLGLSPNNLDELHRAALLHDIGKIGIPLSILDKPGALDDEEYAMIKKHPTIGARILKPIASYKNIIPIVLQHHERYDGKGYPEGISGNEIDMGARILAVADVYDALRSERPYREGWALERVINLIKEEAGRQFDPGVVKAFLEIMRLEKTKAA